MGKIARPAKPARPARIRVGIGSWADREYTPLLFPAGVAPEERLGIYATHFGHVEVNATAYRTPQRATVAAWARQTPADFRFAVKLHRAFADRPAQAGSDGDFVARWRDALQPLMDAGKLAALLLVMPPGFAPPRRRLEELDAVAQAFAPVPLAVELRHRDWVSPDRRPSTLAFFRSRLLVWVAVDMPRLKGSTLMPAVDEVTNPQLAYLRLHGRNDHWPKLKSAEERHTYNYSKTELAEIARRVKALAARAENVHVVANNHAQDFAPKAALALQRLLAAAPGASARRGRGA